MLAQIRNMPPPTSPTRELFDFVHYQDHLAIVRAIKAALTLKKTLILHQIYPRPPDFQTFLENHQTLHDDMTSVLNLNRWDLTQLNDQDDSARNHWAWCNWDQHLAVHRALNLP